MNNELGVPTGRPSLGTEGATTSDANLGGIQLPNFSVPPPTANTVRASPELLQLIRGIISETVNEIPVNNELSEETISDITNLNELDKIPDIVKCFRDFSGDPSEFSAWRKSVDRVFQLYGHLRGSSKYYGILSTIRNKITGQANTVLESYNTPLNWQAIKLCLSTHFADKRDISTLEYQLSTLVQGNKTIEEFYQKVYSHFSLILNKISNMGLENTTESILIATYRNKTLDTFIRGLNGDLPRLLAIREPADLAEALHICTKLANQNYRTAYANNNQINYRPNLPPKRPTQNFRPNQRNQNNIQFYPELAHFENRNHMQNNFNNYQNQRQDFRQFFQPGQPNQNQTFARSNQQQMINRQTFDATNLQNNIPPRPTAPKPAEPMDVDHSIRSAMVNYANRPGQRQNYLGKRNNFTQQSNFFTKQPRQSNLNTLESTNIDPMDMRELQNCLEDQYDTSLNEYMSEYEEQGQNEQENTNTIDVSDIHFLG